MYRISILILSFLSGLSLQLYAQENLPGAHAKHHAEFSKPDFKTEKEYDAHYEIPKTHGNPLSRKCIVNKQVYGWHPAWSGTSYKQYDFAILNHVGYFAYEVDSKTGGYTTINHWRETEIVTDAHKSGAQVELTASLFGKKQVTELLNNPKATKTLRDSLLSLIKLKDADGICIDFEGMGKANRGPFVAFIDSLRNDLSAWNKNASLTLALYAIDWGGAFDIPSLVPFVDRFIVMGYDYHYSGSPHAGPVAPLASSQEWGKHSVTTSLEAYLKAGVPKEKLLLGVPYYGYRWNTKKSSPKSATEGAGTAVLLRHYMKSDSAAMLEWDSASTTGWLAGKHEGQPQQLWIDQGASLGAKYELVNQMGLGGIGIWALGYDSGTSKYWDLLKKNFADCNASNTAELAKEYQPDMPPLEGQTSAERNTWNWVWMLIGGVISVGIIWLAIRYM